MTDPLKKKKKHSVTLYTHFLIYIYILEKFWCANDLCYLFVNLSLGLGIGSFFKFIFGFGVG